MALKYKHSILLVDDEISITKSLQRLFRKEPYNIMIASSGQEGLDILKNTQKPVSLIISDQRMPGMDGVVFLEKAKQIFPDAIRFLLTGYSDMNAIIEAVNRGKIHRYLAKPWNDDDMLHQVRQSLEQFELIVENRRLLSLTKKQNIDLKELNINLEKKVNERSREILQKNKELDEVNKKLESSFMNSIRLLSSLIETFNPRLGRIMRNVAELSREVASEFSVDSEELDNIEMAGMIHDIGLLGLPERILIKDETEMDEKEFRAFSQHPAIASICLESVEKLSKVGEIILYHHERYDGKGFPNGIKGEEIPIGSRILLAVSDYCWILHTWPKDSKQIIDRAQKYISGVKNDLVSTDPEKLLEEIAQKILLIDIHQKYDHEVVTNLIRKLGGLAKSNVEIKQKKKQVFSVSLKDLKEGMVLNQDLRTRDGRLLLVKGTNLKDSLINAIKNIAELQLIDDKIVVSI